MSKQSNASRLGANPLMAQAMREIRRSNAAVPHVPGPRKGTRRAQERRAIDDYR
ncbi:MAG: hypothetical protein QM708_02805 [Propioniciclava sp.]|uniref:hypothetical protein n=1 Tax=Propioniciclava sp. TaxID=2038686 RepID=UPI0039E6B15E